MPRKPKLRRVLGDVEMDDSPSMVIKYNHSIKHPKRRGRNDEHVDRDDDCLAGVKEMPRDPMCNFRGGRLVRYG